MSLFKSNFSYSSSFPSQIVSIEKYFFPPPVIIEVTFPVWFKRLRIVHCPKATCIHAAVLNSLRTVNLDAWILFQTLVVQVKCFEEIINIGYAVYRIHGLPWFRSLSWYFLVTSNYFFYGESLVDYFGVATSRTVSFTLKRRRSCIFFSLISVLNVAGLPQVSDYVPSIHFILLIHRWIRLVRVISSQKVLHEAVLAICLDPCRTSHCSHTKLSYYTECLSRSHLVSICVFLFFLHKNECFGAKKKSAWIIFHLIFFRRFIVPVSMIVCNDVWAYIFGFFLGKTPLIQLSPKKTWEGFIGGGVATIIFGLCVSQKIYLLKALVFLKIFLIDINFFRRHMSSVNTNTSYAPSSIATLWGEWPWIVNQGRCSDLLSTYYQSSCTDS